MGGPVDDDMANLIVAQLLYLDSTGKEDITMYVNSPGGSVTAGQAPLTDALLCKYDAALENAARQAACRKTVAAGDI